MRRALRYQMLLLPVLLAMRAQAAIFFLDAIDDLPDTNPGDGVALTESGTTTLRAAIEEANALPGKDEIIFTYGASQKSEGNTRSFRAGVALVTAPLIIADDLLIEKGNFPYSRFDPSTSTGIRVLEVTPGVSFEMNGIRIEQRQTGFQHIVADRGAAIYIHPGARVTLSGCTVRHGIATVAGGGVYVDRATLDVRGGETNGSSDVDGGGIYNDHGIVYVKSNAYLYGSAGNMGGALFNDEGAVYFSRGAWHTNVNYGEAAAAGGGIYSTGGSIVMESVSVFGNNAPLGGSICLASGATLDLFGSVFAENGAGLDGASIYLDQTSILRATLCTFVRGSAGRAGAGAYLAGGSAMFLNCTFTENTAATESTGAGGGLAVDVAGSAVCMVGNSIVAGNTAQLGQPGVDVSGPIISLGHNLIGVAEGATGFTATDHLGTLVSPLSPVLQYTFLHEGTPESPYRIYIPQPASPVIDAGDNALLSHPDFIGGVCFDARLTCCPRVRGEAVDIGAIEVQEGEIGLTCTGTHSADYDTDSRFSLSELLRAIQLYNSEEFHCASFTEDGYDVGPGDQTCAPHSSDYAPQDWRIGIIEFMRVIQFYNMGGYRACPEGEDGFCPGVG